MCNESNVFILFYFLWGCYGGALVFLGGAGAPASPSLAPPMLIEEVVDVLTGRYSSLRGLWEFLPRLENERETRGGRWKWEMSFS